MAQLYLENFYQFWLLSWNSFIGQFVQPVEGNRVKGTYVHFTLSRVNDSLVKDPRNNKYIFKFNVWICFAILFLSFYGWTEGLNFRFVSSRQFSILQWQISTKFKTIFWARNHYSLKKSAKKTLIICPCGSFRYCKKQGWQHSMTDFHKIKTIFRARWNLFYEKIRK